MRIKTTITDQDLDHVYDILIITTFAMLAMGIVAKLIGVV